MLTPTHDNYMDPENCIRKGSDTVLSKGDGLVHT